MTKEGHDRNGHVEQNEIPEIDRFSATSDKFVVMDRNSEHDSMRTYLRDMGSYILLSRTDEIALGYAIKTNYDRVDELRDYLVRLVFKRKNNRSKDRLLDILSRLYSDEEMKKLKEDAEKNPEVPALLGHSDKIKISEDDPDENLSGTTRRWRECRAVADYYKKHRGSERGPSDEVDRVLFVTYKKPKTDIMGTLHDMLHYHHQAEFWKREMVKSNLKLVPGIAKKHAGGGLDLIDLISEGNQGVIRAAEKFTVQKGYKFSTYATWWIRQSITRAIADKSHTIRLPVHVHDNVRRIRRAVEKFYNEHGREPTTDDIVKIEVEGEKLMIFAETKKMPNAGQLKKITALADNSVRRAKDLLETQVNPLSLDMFIGESGDTAMSDVVPDTERLRSEQENLLNLDLKDFAKTAVCYLNDLKSRNPKSREAEVISLRFGLNGEIPHTLQEVGTVLKITRERVRQIEEKAIKKLRRKLKRNKELLALVR